MSLNIAQKCMKEMVKIYFGLLKIQVKFLINWNSRGFLASCLSTYDFSTLYTTLPHNLIKEKLTELIEQILNREGSLYLACNDKKCLFLLLNHLNNTNCGHVRKCVMLFNIFIRFGLKLNRQIVGIPMGTNCPPLVADLFFVLL